MKKLFSFVLVAVAALCVATNVYAMRGEGTFNLNGDDFSSFRALYNHVNTLGITDEDYYTTTSWGTYATAKTQADVIVVDNGFVNPTTGDYYTDAELAGLKTTLLDAVNGLVPVADYSALNVQITRFDALNEDLYTTSSYNNAKADYDAAVLVAQNTDQGRDAYQLTIDRARIRLSEAIDALVPVNEVSEELIKHDEIVADQLENETYTTDSYVYYTDEVKNIVDYLGGDYDTNDYSAIAGITRGNDVDVEYAHQLFEARNKLIRVNKPVISTVPANDPSLPPIPNTADAVVSYIIMMVMGIAGITIFGKKLANSK